MRRCRDSDLCAGLPVDVAAVPDRDDHDEQLTVLDLVDEAVIADAVAPKLRELTRERFPGRPGIFGVGYLAIDGHLSGPSVKKQ